MPSPAKPVDHNCRVAVGMGLWRPRGIPMRTTRLAFSAALAVFLVANADAHAGQRCGDAPGDEAAVAALRGQVNAECDCSTATSHRDYVKCAKRVTKQATNVSHDCRKKVLHCTSSSTCGRPNSVTCCRTDKKGRTKCSIEDSAAECKPPKGGTACAGSFSSCCDACGNGSCTPPETRCCLADSAMGALVCTSELPAECVADGGTDIGPGECTEDSCSGISTTTTTISSTSTSISTSTTSTSTSTSSSTSLAQTIQCCLPSSPGGAMGSAGGAFVCSLETADACAAAGGTNAGPGSCTPDPCNGASTTSTSSSSSTTSSVTTTSTSTSTSTSIAQNIQCCLPSSPGGAMGST